MTETVGRHGEFHGDERLVAPAVKLPAIGEDIVHNQLGAGETQKLMHNDPLVMPTHDPLRLGENFVGSAARHSWLGLHIIDYRIVKAQEAEMKLGDDQVF